MPDILTPTLGESVAEATVARWTKKPGDAVKKDEVLVELETDKVSLEVSAPSDGVLQDVSAGEGATVTPGQVLGRVTDGASGGPAAPAPATPEPACPTPAAAAAPAGELQPEPQPNKPPPQSAPVPDTSAKPDAASGP